MIMADKIIELRKKSGWSQEELAEKLHVSRQAVSKWEGVLSVPDLNKVIAMAEIFNVSTDYLLKDDMGPESIGFVGSGDDSEDGYLRRVSMEEASAFLEVNSRAAREISLGVMLCILSPIFVIMLSLAGAEGKISLSETQGGIMGTLLLILIVAGAVFLFVTNGMRLSKYGYLEKEPIDTEYGVSGMARERRQDYEHTHMVGITLGVILCILSVIPLLLTSMFEGMSDLDAGAGASLALALTAIGVRQIVNVSVKWGAYQKLLEEGDYDRRTKRKNRSSFSGIYWLAVTAVYLGYSFWSADWAKSWIIWPVAALLYGVLLGIEDVIVQRKQD